MIKKNQPSIFLSAATSSHDDDDDLAQVVVVSTSELENSNRSKGEEKVNIKHQPQQQSHRKTIRRRQIMISKAEVLQRVIKLCVDNICNLIQKYGWHRVDRQLQHASRGREFICSMLYLMRMGITFKNQTILQKMEILNSLLPLQVFLPTIFNIRAKSITEGENIIKLDLQHIPL